MTAALRRAVEWTAFCTVMSNMTRQPEREQLENAWSEVESALRM